MEHEDLIDNIDRNLAYDFVDIDTAYWTEYGFVLIEGADYTEPDPEPIDIDGHGTHCSGIIGAKVNNNLGISGIAPNISIVPLKVAFDEQYEGALFLHSNIVSGIDYAVLNGIDVLSMSFGGSYWSDILSGALANAADNNVVLIAAAGNSSTDLLEYPAAYENVIAVASTDPDDSKSSFSNYGNWVDVCAPGNEIYSTFLKAKTMGTGYSYQSGTSMATPFVAGLAGLILSKNPEISPACVEYILKNTSNLPEEKLNYIGAGLVNVYKALTSNITDAPTLQAEFTNITDFQLINNDFDIHGTASGKKYKIYIGSNMYSTEWTIIDSGITTNNGYLGKLKIANFNTGLYYIKLVTETNGFISVSAIKPIKVLADKEKMLAGFPIQLPFSVPSDSDIDYSHILIEDLNYDGKKEIIVTYNDENSFNVYDYQGKLFSSNPFVLPAYSTIDVKPCIADLNKNGSKEIIILSYNGVRCFLSIYDYNGNILNNGSIVIPRRRYADTDLEFLSLADLNGDNELEIIISTQNDEGYFITAYNKDGEELPGWPFLIESNFELIGKPIIADITNDGNEEIIFASYNSVLNFETAIITTLNYFGEATISFKYTKGYSEKIAGGDIDNDGKIDIISSSGSFDANGNPMEWINPNNNYSLPIVLGNINDGSELEILTGSDTDITLIDYKDGSLSGWPKTKEDFSVNGNQLIIDINGDGIKEIIVNWKPYYSSQINSNPGICAYDPQGNMLDNFPKYEYIYYFNQVLFDDLDGNGIGELICYNLQNSQLLAIEMEGQYNSQDQEWSSYLHDNRSTNNYNTKPENTVIFNVPDITINEDEESTIRSAPEYLDMVNYNITTKLDTSAIEYSLSHGILHITPKPNWNGEVDFSITFNDGIIKDSSNFHLTVTPVQDKPTEFSLLEPNYSTHIDIDETTKNDTIQFRWENSFDADSTQLYYSVIFPDTLSFMSCDSLESNSYSVPLIHLSNFLTNNDLDMIVVCWSIICYDEIDTVEASNNPFSLLVTKGMPTGIEENSIPNKIFLSQNYPNPFNPTAIIEYGLPKESHVSLKVYDMLGQLVETLVDDNLNAGYHQINFNAGQLASGIYIYRLEAENISFTKKMMLVK